MKTSPAPENNPVMHLWAEGLMDQSDPSVRRQQMVTVIRMRTLALAAQLLLLAVVGLLLKVSLPWAVLAFILGALALLNVITFIRLQQENSVGNFEVAAQLFADLAAFSFILYFTGGVTNPFVSLYLPLLGLAAALLPWAQVAVLALFSVVAYTLLMGNYMPLVLANPDDGVHFHLVGMWLNFLVSVLILVVFVARLSSSIRNRDQALGRAQQRLASESRLAALGNQAASIAHQLGTPVSTIATIISDWKSDPAMQAQTREMNILSAQVQSITETLGQLRNQIEVDPRHNADAEFIKPSEWLQATLGIWRTRNPQHELQLLPSIASITGEFKVRKELLELGLITLLDNASQSQQRASVSQPLQVGMQCDHEKLTLFVNDAGGGIDPELLSKIGQQLFQANGQGMGLFLLANLLEREGGKLNLRNLNPGVCASLSLPVLPQ
ncbi:ATP-binding protein [Limnobacter sp.]|jgi:two-component system sensor histidine kinase RegB|uniref:ATP-binding protein n=1 Tax=Limnobacter sp. TaxID=2003368 RepID=UPI0039BD6898